MKRQKLRKTIRKFWAMLKEPDLRSEEQDLPDTLLFYTIDQECPTQVTAEDV